MPAGRPGCPGSEDADLEDRELGEQPVGQRHDREVQPLDPQGDVAESRAVIARSVHGEQTDDEGQPKRRVGRDGALANAPMP
jgi:hypothetical protein